MLIDFYALYLLLNISAVKSRHVIFSFFLLIFGFNQEVISNPISDRNEDPVIATGANVSCILNQDFSNLVGFKYDNGWLQVPIQIDERVLLEIATPYGPFASNYTGSSPYNVLFYADPNTYIGADADPNFDADDELVFMAKDMGFQNLSSTDPSGTIAGSCCELSITDPLTNEVSFLYLFQQDGSLMQDAGVDYVTYNFNLLAGTYPNDFSIPSGTNNEQSTVSTANYNLGFSAEWVLDEWNILAAGSNGDDILDRHQNFFAPGFCLRSEDTFSAAENCFVSNIDGPVRAIRSVMGANSGPLTQRTNFFYESRHDIHSDLRVHTVPVLYDVFDFETNIAGMQYFSNTNMTGILIDGNVDTYNTGLVEWELVTGPSGSLIISHDEETDMVIGTDATIDSYYEDNVANSASDCTGDNLAYGTCGRLILFGSNICTHPFGGGCNQTNFRSLNAIRRVYSMPSNTSTAEAISFNDKAKNPLQVSSNSSCCLNSISISGLPYSTASNSPIALTALPIGGTFSGNGVVFNAFNPAVAGPGIHTITYTYDDGNGCQTIQSQDILVFNIAYNFVNYNLGTIAP